jgi:predicted nucleotide-binding protein (sugar kinase/HSP70/actin superfamily)
LDLSNCQFVYHDGRHRAVAADELGVKEIPVFIEHDVPANEEQRRCLQNRNLWKKEAVSSPDLRHFEKHNKIKN